MTRQTDISSFLNLLYNITFIPIHFYKGDTLISAFPPNELPVDFISVYKHMLTESTENVSYRSTKEFLFIGIVQNFNTSESVIVGPISNVSISTDMPKR